MLNTRKANFNLIYVRFFMNSLCSHVSLSLVVHDQHRLRETWKKIV